MREKFSTPENQSRENEKQEIEQGLEDYEFSLHGEKTDKLDKVIEDNLLQTQDFFDQEGYDVAWQIYYWYAKAIERREREPLERESFFHHFFEGGSTDQTYMFGDMEKGFLLGVLKSRVFIPTHFAPRAIRGGYELISQLGTGELPAALAITKDLAETLRKMPEWKVEDIEIPSSFRGEETKKMVAHNRHPQVRVLMVDLLSEYLGKTQEEANENIEKMGKAQGKAA